MGYKNKNSKLFFSKFAMGFQRQLFWSLPDSLFQLLTDGGQAAWAQAQMENESAVLLLLFVFHSLCPVSGSDQSPLGTSDLGLTWNIISLCSSMETFYIQMSSFFFVLSQINCVKYIFFSCCRISLFPLTFCFVICMFISLNVLFLFISYFHKAIILFLFFIFSNRFLLCIKLVLCLLSFGQVWYRYVCACFFPLHNFAFCFHLKFKTAMKLIRQTGSKTETTRFKAQIKRLLSMILRRCA